MVIIFLRKNLNTNLCFSAGIWNNKPRRCTVYIMNHDANLYYFLNYLKEIYGEFKFDVENSNHFDWKGSKTNNFLNISNVNKVGRISYNC